MCFVCLFVANACEFTHSQREHYELVGVLMLHGSTIARVRVHSLAA